MIIGDNVNRDKRHKKQVMGGHQAVRHPSIIVIVIDLFWAKKWVSARPPAENFSNHANGSIIWSLTDIHTTSPLIL